MAHPTCLNILEKTSTVEKGPPVVFAYVQVQRPNGLPIWVLKCRGASQSNKAKDEHLRTFWPLMLQCGSEDSANYVPGFVALQDALSESEIPGSCQVHLDWYSARSSAGLVVLMLYGCAGFPWYSSRGL